MAFSIHLASHLSFPLNTIPLVSRRDEATHFLSSTLSFPLRIRLIRKHPNSSNTRFGPLNKVAFNCRHSRSQHRILAKSIINTQPSHSYSPAATRLRMALRGLLLLIHLKRHLKHLLQMTDSRNRSSLASGNDDRHRLGRPPLIRHLWLRHHPNALLLSQSLLVIRRRRKGRRHPLHSRTRMAVGETRATRRRPERQEPTVWLRRLIRLVSVHAVDLSCRRPHRMEHQRSPAVAK